jgi:O-antigen/teichoic acid export membrane protein
MLSFMKGDAVVGWYAAASNLTYGLKPIPHLFMSALFPLMSYYFISSKDLLKKSYEKSFKYLFYLGLPISVGTLLLSEKIILFLYGPEFSNSIIALQILSWDILLIFLYACAAFLLISIDKQNIMALVAGSTALINVILNLLLIPQYSYIGAAIATITAEGFLLISYLYLNVKYIHGIPFHKIIFKPMIACGVMGLFLLQITEINLFVQIFLSIIIYCFILFLLKGFTSEDISMFKRIINR